MGLVVGLLFAAGVLAMWTSSVPKPRPAQSHPIVSRSHLAAVGGAAAGGVGALILTGLPIVGVMALVVGAYVPTALRSRQRKRQASVRAHAWPEVIDSLVSAVRAGMSLPEALSSVGMRGPDCLKSEFAAFADDYRTTGQFDTAIANLRDRLKDPVADRVCEAMLVAREVGGSDLGQMLRTLSDFVRQDLRLRDEVTARRSWTVNGARLAVAAPWIVLVLLSSQPEVVEAYRSAEGIVVLSASALICVLAYWLMSKIAELPAPGRLS